MINADADYFLLVQETFIDNHSLLSYLWRGNYYATSGLGNSKGCITLMSSHINVIEAKEFDNRAHILVCQKSNSNSASYIVANIYAPCPNTQEKILFFVKH